MSSLNPVWDNDIKTTQQGFNSSKDSRLHSDTTPNTITSNGIQPLNYGYQLTSFHTLEPSSIAQFELGFRRGLQDAKEYNGRSGPKLGYKRASVACSK